MIILIRIHVSILYQNCGLATCKNEKYFYDYYNEFEYNHDLVVIVFIIVIVVIIRVNFT